MPPVVSLPSEPVSFSDSHFQRIYEQLQFDTAAAKESIDPSNFMYTEAMTSNELAESMF